MMVFTHGVEVCSVGRPSESILLAHADGCTRGLCALDEYCVRPHMYMQIHPSTTTTTTILSPPAHAPRENKHTHRPTVLVFITLRLFPEFVGTPSALEATIAESSAPAGKKYSTMGVS